MVSDPAVSSSSQSLERTGEEQRRVKQVKESKDAMHKIKYKVTVKKEKKGKKVKEV
jgi:hypothetical protein